MNFHKDCQFFDIRNNLLVFCVWWQVLPIGNVRRNGYVVQDTCHMYTKAPDAPVDSCVPKHECIPC